MRSLLVLVCAALTASGCSRKAPPRGSTATASAVDAAAAVPSASSVAAPVTMWPAGVLAYPGARAICNQHLVMRPTLAADQGKPWREVAWQSYGVADDAARVIAFYNRDAGAITTDGDETTIYVDGGIRLSIFTLPTKRVFPKCADGAPAATERALIVVHKQTIK